MTLPLSRRALFKYLGAGLVSSARGFSGTSRTPQVCFTDVARVSGIAINHDNAASAEKYLIETMGSGCGWIDYDQYGLLDLYLVNGPATRR